MNVTPEKGVSSDRLLPKIRSELTSLRCGLTPSFSLRVNRSLPNATESSLVVSTTDQPVLRSLVRWGAARVYAVRATKTANPGPVRQLADATEVACDRRRRPGGPAARPLLQAGSPEFRKPGVRLLCGRGAISCIHGKVPTKYTNPYGRVSDSGESL